MHPQDIQVNQILDRICKVRYGNNWENPKEVEESLSNFDM